VRRACRSFGSSQPQEGAEHAVAYNAEYITNRPFIHGELVALGTLVIASLQENEPAWVREVLERTGVVFQPADLGIGRAEFVEILRTLNGFARAHGRRYTVLRAREVDQAFIDRMCDQLRF
jgi:glycerol dehydrogenase-like iron-containing ADH family enzyme